MSLSSNNDAAAQNQGHFIGQLGDFSKIFKGRNRVRSHDDEVTAHHFVALQNAFVPNEQWKDIPFKSEDDRVSRFIDYLEMYPEHQSQLF